jgi:hypothetical protein
MGRYAMESWHRTGLACHPDGGEWRRMDDPANRGPKAWAPRALADEAAWKCLVWTGRVGVPAMRVVDLETDEVVWCWGAASLFEAGAGPWVLPGWHARMWELAGTGERPYPTRGQRRSVPAVPYRGAEAVPHPRAIKGLRRPGCSADEGRPGS